MSPAYLYNNRSIGEQVSAGALNKDFGEIVAVDRACAVIRVERIADSSHLEKIKNNERRIMFSKKGDETHAMHVHRFSNIP